MRINPKHIGHGSSRMIFVIVLLSVAMHGSFAQWTQTNGPDCGIITSVAVSGTNIIAGTTNGIVLSTHSGTSWGQTALTNIYIQTIAVSSNGADGTNLFAGTYGSGIYRSTDNGSSWSAVDSGLTNKYVNAIAVSGSNLFAGTDGGAFLSTDNGVSWNMIDSNLTNTFVQSLAVVMNAGDTTVFAGTNGNGVFSSTNNGVNWNGTGLSNVPVTALAANGTTLFASINSDTVLCSTNNGTTWSGIGNGLANTTINALTVFDSCLYACTNNGIYSYNLLPLSNGVFPKWNSMGLSNDRVLSFARFGSSFLAGTYGNGFFLSTNNGTNWSNTGLVNTYIYALAVSGTDLFASTNNEQPVSMSSDQGANWATADSGFTSHYITSFAVSGNNLFAGTIGGGVFFSADNGTSWSAVDTGLTNLNVSSLVFSGTNLFAGTYDGGIFLSTNNGTNWSPVDSGLTSIYIQTLAVSGSNLYAGTTYNGVFLSTNNGTTWAQVDSGMTDTMVTSLAVIGTSIFAGTNSGGVFLTTNNGISWSAVDSGLTNARIQALTVSSNGTNSGNIFAGTNGGGVFLSTNNGTSWNAIDNGLTNPFISVLAASSTTLYAGTYGSGVWSRPLSDIITGIARTPAQEPRTFSLAQNFPNPFNPSTTIAFSIPSKSHVTLKIYDILGREVATLINSDVSAGSHTQQWNASNFSSGIYFYRLQAGSLNQTKKLLLLR
ncbi:MAG TPA: T9SS type A sorting domain-containing protein [Bacteroidota bacterium]|nr:T9SS type A sorting domain-containing protein [Bacteroidota bacterium]